MSDRIAWKYTGPGFYYGVPATDLTEAEFDALLPEDQRIVRLAPEYVEATGEKKDDTGEKSPSSKKGGDQ